MLTLKRITEISKNIRCLVEDLRVRLADAAKRSAIYSIPLPPPRLDGMHELENAKLNPKVQGAEGSSCRPSDRTAGEEIEFSLQVRGNYMVSMKARRC